MHVALDPSEEIPHLEWLRAKPGAYEWWYFDAVSDDREYAFAAIWFLGNPFSPYTRMAALGQDADPFDHNALFFALYRHGRLYAYHFSRFPSARAIAAGNAPLCLQFGGSTLDQQDWDQNETAYRLRLDDVNANRRRVRASLDFVAPSPPAPSGDSFDPDAADHIWRPAAPHCRVAAHIQMTSAMDVGVEEINFSGAGYHDHNRGLLPFSPKIREWYWARVALPGEQTLVVYHTRMGDGEWKTDMMRFAAGALVDHDVNGRCRLIRWRVNAFGLIYASSLTVEGQGMRAVIHFRERLDSAPFYLRLLCEADVSVDGRTISGNGIGEYLRPRGMDWALTASAMKARIVEQ